MSIPHKGQIYRIILDISSPRSLNWGIQIAGMIFQIRSSICSRQSFIKKTFGIKFFHPAGFFVQLMEIFILHKFSDIVQH